MPQETPESAAIVHQPEPTDTLSTGVEKYSLRLAIAGINEALDKARAEDPLGKWSPRYARLYPHLPFTKPSGILAAQARQKRRGNVYPPLNER